MKSGLVLYPAAALFCARETVFNYLLVQELEQEYGYQSWLPQRDGFEFSKLANYLKKHLTPEYVSSAVEDVIYLADMGLFVPNSQVVVANLDEPLDPGVLIEIAHARALGKFVIGYRTDVRSPYGDLNAPLRGIHFFPAYQCHAFLFLTHNCRDEKDVKLIIQQLASKIHAVIEADYSEEKHAGAALSVELQELIGLSKDLFKDLQPLNSEASLESIAVRYAEIRSRIATVRPKVIGSDT